MNRVAHSIYEPSVRRLMGRTHNSARRRSSHLGGGACTESIHGNLCLSSFRAKTQAEFFKFFFNPGDRARWDGPSTNRSA